MVELSGRPFGVFLLRKRNVWYSIQNGNWSDPNTWESNTFDRNVITSPRPNDVVYINHTVTFDTGATTNLIIGELYGSGSLVFAAGMILNIAGTMNMAGNITMTAANSFMDLRGVANYLGSLTTGASTSTVEYNCVFSGQVVMPFTYKNLTVGGSGTSSAGGDITVNGNFTIGDQQRVLQTTYDLLGFNLSVAGTTTINGPGTLRKSIGTGTTLFTGMVTFAGSSTTADFSGNSDFEFRGGLTFNALTPSFSTNFGSGTMKFTTTAAQNIKFVDTFVTINIQVGSGVTLSNISTSRFYNAGTVDGVDGTSTFNNDGQYYLLSSTLPMAGAGIFNYKHTAGTTLGFIGPGNLTLPYTSYENLVISGVTGTTSGIKTLSGNTTLAGNITIGTQFGTPNNSGTLECSTFDLTVNGTTLIQKGNAVTLLSKTGSGTIIFVGLLTCATGSSPSFALATGAPTVELRGGLTYAGLDDVTTLGNGWKFTTNNQTITTTSGTNWGNMLISGAITVTHSGGVGFSISGTLNGDNASSTFKNNANFTYYNTTAPMATGVLDTSTTVGNVFIYGNNSGSTQDIKGGTYKNLTLLGSGAKRLLGNVSVINTYTLTSPATLNSNGFALTNP